LQGEPTSTLLLERPVIAMKKHELFKFMATIHPELRRQLEHWGPHVLDRIQSVVQQKHELATRLRHADRSEPDLYVLEEGLIAILFTVEEWWLVIRGLGESQAADPGSQDHGFFIVMDPAKSSLH
jgi:hypothetical protein